LWFGALCLICNHARSRPRSFKSAGWRDSLTRYRPETKRFRSDPVIRSTRQVSATPCHATSPTPRAAAGHRRPRNHRARTGVRYRAAASTERRAWGGSERAFAIVSDCRRRRRVSASESQAPLQARNRCRRG